MRAAQLELQIAAVRRELVRALDEHRELGLQVSLLSRQREVAWQNLSRTEQYLQSVQSGYTPLSPGQHPIPGTGGEQATRTPAEAPSTAATGGRRGISRKPRWRRAVDHIKIHTGPVLRRQRELSTLQEQLAASRAECRRLEQTAKRLESERDQALARLERAAAGLVLTRDTRHAVEQQAPVAAPAVAPVAPAVTLSSLQAKLQRVQAKKNDIEIALAERDDQIADLESERAQLQGEIQQLDVRLSDLQQDLATAQRLNQALTSELGAVRDELHRAGSRDGEQIATLQRRMAEVEGQRAAYEVEQQRLLTEAEELRRQVSEAEQGREQGQLEALALRPEVNELGVQLKRLQGALQESEARFAEAEQRRQALSERLREEIRQESSKAAAREQQREQLAQTLEMERKCSAAEIDSLGRQLAATSGELDGLNARFRSAEETLHRVQAANNDAQIALAERDDEIATLQAEREQLQNEIERLAPRLSVLQQDLAIAQQSNQALVSELDALRGELHDTRSRDGEQIAALQQRVAATEAELEGARETRAALERELQAAAAKRADLVRQLSGELEQERSSSAARDRQLGELRERDEQQRAEIDKLTRQLAVAGQEYETVKAENRAFAQQLESHVSKSESARTQVQQELAALQQRLAEGGAARDAALQRAKALETALADAAAALADSEKRRETLATGLQEHRNRLDERDRQRVALQARQQQLLAEADGLKRRASAAEQGRAEMQQETRALRVELDDLVVQLKALQTALESAEARVADSELRRRALSDELLEERSQVIGREQQLGEMQAREKRLQAELEALAQRLSGVQQELSSSGEKNRSLEQDKQALVDEYAASRRRDRDQIEALEHRLAELEPQLSAAQKQVEDLQLSVAEAAYRQELSERRIEELDIQLDQASKERHSAAQSSLSQAPEPLQPKLQAVQLIPGKALQPVAAAGVAVRPHRRRGWVRAAAGLALVLGVVAGATKLRDLIWADPSVALLGSDQDRGTSELPPDAAGTSSSGAKRAAETARAEAEKPNQTLLYVERSQRHPRHLASATEPAGLPEAETRADRAGDMLRAKVENTKQPPFAAALAQQMGGQNSAGVQVEAYLMEEAASARALKRRCESGAAAQDGCSDIEKRFMKDTVVELPSGVKYKVIRNGSGRSPTAGDTVVVSYRGLLPDGTQFDSAGPGGQSEAFRLSQAIPGLQDVLQYMEEGAKWEVYLPSQLAFPKPGPLGAQEVIFVIELVAVLNSQASPVATGPVNDASPVSALGLSGEESYWQIGDEGSEPESGGEADLSRQYVAVDAETFFRENASLDGVVSLPSGLQYRVLKDGNGSGRSPKATDTVTLNYRGTLPDGREISRSEEATQFRLGEVLPAWQEALQQMEEGAQWELYIPPSLTRRSGTRKRSVRGGQPVIYQVELVSVHQPGDPPVEP